MALASLASDVIFFSSRTRIRHAGFSSAGHGTLHRHYPSFGLYDHGYITTLVCRYGGFFPFLFFTFLQLEGMMLSFMHQSLAVLTLYALTSVGIFSILFFIHFLRRWLENLFTNQRLFPLVIISFILMTLMWDSVVILWGEIRLLKLKIRSQSLTSVDSETRNQFNDWCCCHVTGSFAVICLMVAQVVEREVGSMPLSPSPTPGNGSMSSPSPTGASTGLWTPLESAKMEVAISLSLLVGIIQVKWYTICLLQNVSNSLKEWFFTVGYHGSGEAGICGDVLVGSIDQRFYHRISGIRCHQPIEAYTRTESSSDHWTTCFSEGNYAMSPLFFQTICRILGKEISKFEKITSLYSTKITVKSYPSEQLTWKKAQIQVL